MWSHRTSNLFNHGNDSCLPPLVVREQVLDIFQQERLWPFSGDDARYVKKQGALRGAFKPMRTAKGIFLGYASDAEWPAHAGCSAREPASASRNAVVVSSEILNTTTNI